VRDPLFACGGKRVEKLNAISLGIAIGLLYFSELFFVMKIVYLALIFIGVMMFLRTMRR
jgi:hypothetical protein